MFTRSLKTLFTAAILVTGLATTPVIAGEGGEGGGREADISEPGRGHKGNRKKSPDFATLHNPDGSSVTIKRSVFGGLVIAKKDRRGRVVEKRRVRNKRNAFVTLHNPDGSTSTIQRGPGGRVQITDRDPAGAVTGVRNVN